ncbi:DUF4325 domain-containing protein [Heliobacillus mobilis]|uniref:DUF4325 domain-containing protein n=1 Tax=Heliobacterium mobile TaxID=28064 RepID=A0A6I3SR05_HELMO|nr:STAS-like domain-containing protein [Heliobacterium mobile]MTV50832.1 DUF4325 domain-containing protein [Heliobacterium mobile]
MFNRWGEALLTRSLGKSASRELRGLLIENSGKIVLDFDGVDIINNAFADEVFGKLSIDIGLPELKKRTTFRNVNPFIETVIKSAINERLAEVAMRK